MLTFDDIPKLKSYLLTHSPFIASFVFGLAIKQNDNDKECPTAQTNGKQIEFNSHYLSELDFKEGCSLLAHEIAHVAFAHHYRMRGKNLEAWNIATDHAINLLLKSMGFKIPSNWYCDEKHRGKSAEDIYSELMRQSPQEKKQSQQGKQIVGEMSEPKSDDGSSMSDSELEEEKQKAKEKLVSAKDNLKRMMDAIQKSDLSEKEKRERISMCGKGMHELIGEVAFESSSRVCWRDVLARFLSAISQNDYAIHVPDHRFIATSDFLMPSLHSEELGNVFIALDVSGSCADQCLQLLTEAREVLAMMQSSMHIVACYCSDYIHAIDKIDHESKLKRFYGGGTDFKPAIDKYAMDDECCACVYLTDGYCNSFGNDPMKPVLWVLTRRNDNFKPPFGEVVIMQ